MKGPGFNLIFSDVMVVGDRLLDAAIDDDGYEWQGGGGEYLDI